LHGRDVYESIFSAQARRRARAGTVWSAPRKFASADELLGQGQRVQFTTPEAVNATGQLRAGRRVAIKGLLIAAENEPRLNLLSVQPIADACP
jgi:hypothetical protein